MGKSYLIGEDKDNTLKLDIFYTDKFIQPIYLEDTIRMATIEEIIAMKLDVVQRVGRKKDFWDLHAFIDKYRLEQLLKLHEQRHKWTHDRNKIIKNISKYL